MKIFITLLISGIFTNNIITHSLLGVEELEKSKTKPVITLLKDCAVFTYPVLRWVLAPLKLEYLSALVCVALICAVIFGVYELTKRFLPKIYSIIKENGNMLACSPAVLGLCLMNLGSELITGYPQALLYSVISGIGFTVVSLMFYMINQRIYESNLSDTVRGLPMTLIIAAIISLAFGGLAGI